MRKFKFELDEQMAQVVLNGLAELPFKVSAATVKELMKQVNEQNKPAQEPVKKELKAK